MVEHSKSLSSSLTFIHDLHLLSLSLFNSISEQLRNMEVKTKKKDYIIQKLLIYDLHVHSLITCAICNFLGEYAN